LVNGVDQNFSFHFLLDKYNKILSILLGNLHPNREPEKGGGLSSKLGDLKLKTVGNLRLILTLNLVDRNRCSQQTEKLSKSLQQNVSYDTRRVVHQVV